MTVRTYAACDGDGCHRTLPLAPSRTARAQLAPAGWTTAAVGDLCPDCSAPRIPGQRQASASQRTIGCWGL